jgi:hypothetical protein
MDIQLAVKRNLSAANAGRSTSVNATQKGERYIKGGACRW